MATVTVSEFQDTKRTISSSIQAPQVPPLAEQTIDFTTSTAMANATQNGTKVIRVHTDTACYIAFGVSPTATTGNLRMAADQTEYFSVNAPIKVAAYDGVS